MTGCVFSISEAISRQIVIVGGGEGGSHDDTLKTDGLSNGSEEVGVISKLASPSSSGLLAAAFVCPPVKS